MITKFVLIVWIGLGYGQMLTVDHFDTLAECKAAAAAIYEVTQQGKDYHICTPYSFEGSEE